MSDERDAMGDKKGANQPDPNQDEDPRGAPSTSQTDQHPIKHNAAGGVEPGDGDVEGLSGEKPTGE